MANDTNDQKTGEQKAGDKAVATAAAKTTGAAPSSPATPGAGDKSGAQANPTPAQTSAAANDDAIALLKADHRKVEELFDQFVKAGTGQKAELARTICAELIIHTILEEEIFYPACEAAAEDKVEEAQVEHDSAKMLIAELVDGGEGDEYRDAKMTVLAEQIRHHIKEEEGPGGIFAKAKSAKLDLADLGRRIAELKQELQRDERNGRLNASEVVSFHHQPSPPRSWRTQQQEDYMPRNSQDRDRDDQGRFTSDDDNRGGERYGRGRDDDDRGGQGRGQSRGQDRGQGGWFGDSEGHSRAARSRDDDDDRGGRGGSRGGENRSYGRGRDDDYRSSGERGGQDRGSQDRGSQDRGQGGWFGDSRGHSEASRRGWDNPNHGDSGWYGDSRGHSEASRRGWDNPNHGDSGWYGDSQGHSEAARRGWEDRDGSRGGSSGGSSRGRDDEARYSSRGRDDDDDRGGRGRGGQDRGQDRGQGGWFGDSAGHSEAARRGWDRR